MITNREDLEPLITALKKPDFIILELTIAAYSSIEGSESQIQPDASEKESRKHCQCLEIEAER
jgi:hypothetical protein